MNYTFYVNADAEVNAVYGKTVNKGIVLNISAVAMTEESKIAFFAERNVPEEYEVIEAGILIGKTAEIEVDNAYAKAIAKSTANVGQYTVRKANVESGVTWYGRAYVIYRNAEGDVLTAYSDVAGESL